MGMALYTLVCSALMRAACSEAVEKVRGLFQGWEPSRRPVEASKPFRVMLACP